MMSLESKFILSVICLLSCTNGQNFADMDPQELQALIRFNTECSAETGVTPIESLGLTRGQFTDSSKIKSHLYCLAKKIGFQNEIGDLQLDSIRGQLSSKLNDDDLVEELMTKCIVQKATPEDTAFDAAKCVYESTQK